MAEGSTMLWDELITFRGLDEKDLGAMSRKSTT